MLQDVVETALHDLCVALSILHVAGLQVFVFGADAVIVGLGEAKGDNWWCVVYPPLCFLSESPVEYRSKIADIIDRFRKKK